MEKCLQSADFLSREPFIQLPKAVNAMKISSEAKLLYGNMADLLKLSQINGFWDEQGLYVFCSFQWITELLGCKNNKAEKVIRELESSQLIRRRRMGQGKPNRYYFLDLPREGQQQSIESTAFAQKTSSVVEKYPPKQNSALEISGIDTSRTFSIEDLESILKRF